MDFFLVYWFIVLFDEVGKMFEGIIVVCFNCYFVNVGLDFFDV